MAGSVRRSGGARERRRVAHGQSWPALARVRRTDSAALLWRLRWHAIRQVDPAMGTGFERESPRPLVLRHAYQSETRRYTPRCPERTLLYRIVAENLETLLQTAREQNESGLGLPKYVEKEFRDYLRCGVLCHGFTRLVCEACGRTMFLAFSCKRRGCCGARRMCNTAAVVVGRVLPEVPLRQWVLSAPFEIRLLLARNAAAFGGPDADIHGRSIGP